MADERIEDISGGSLTAPAVGDLLLVLDVSDTTDDADGTAKNIAYQNVGKLPVSNESGSFTATRNTHHRVTVGTAARTVTMPSSGLLDGDRIRITVAAQGTATGSFAQAPGHAVGFASGTSINGASYTGTTTGKWSLWLTGETLLLEWDVTNSTWWVVDDGRRAMGAAVYNSANDTGAAVASTWSQVELDTASSDVGNLHDATNDEIEIKRGGNRYLLSGLVSINSVPSTNVMRAKIQRNTSDLHFGGVASRPDGGNPSASVVPSVPLEMTSGDTLELFVIQTSVSNLDITGASSLQTYMSALEQL